MNSDQASKLTQGSAGTGGHFFKFWMPYAFQKLHAGGRLNVYLPINRNYKPLGYLKRDHVDYEEYAESHGVKFARDPHLLINIWSNMQADILWLYDDGLKTRLDYFERFERLMTKALPVLGKE